MTANVITVNDRAPNLAGFAWETPTVGDVSVGADSGGLYGAVLRADTETITVEHCRANAATVADCLPVS